MTDTWDWPPVNRAELARYVTPERAVAALGMTPAVPDNTTHDLLARGEQRTLVARIYDDLAARRVSYSLEPVIDSTLAQRIRPPETVLGSDTRPGEGTCLDLAVLFAGLCQHRYLLPIVAVFKDHAIALVSIVDRHDSPYPGAAGVFTDGVCDEAGPLRQLVDNASHLAVECTGIAVTTTSGDPRRSPSGQLTFADACTAGRAALDERELRFAIDPTTLHKSGVSPDDEVLRLDPRVSAFVQGAQQARGATDAIDAALPAVDTAPSGSERDALSGALREVLKTYDVILEVSKEWIEAAVGDAGTLEPDTISSLATGDLVTRIEDRRGHCHRIGELYWNEGGRAYFARQLDDDSKLDEIDDAFRELAGSDDAFFDRATQTGEFLQEQATEVLDAVLAGDTAAVQDRVRTSAKHVAVLQQAVAANRRQLKELGRRLGLDTG
jgi:hypothetical protein